MVEPESTAHSGEDGSAGARARILVVDDSATSREYITGVLSRLPAVELLAVDTGAHALRAIGEGSISLVICDYEMPDISGVQVLQFARKVHSPLELPVLMLTSCDDAEIKMKALRSGANDYITKQAPPEELLARVGTQIELLQAHRRLNESRIRRNEHQKFEALGHLAEGLAHELNTPAQYIQDNLAFLTESFQSLGAVVAELRRLPSAAERSLVETVLQQIEYDYLVEEVPRCLEESKQGINHVARVVAVMREFARPGMQEPAAHSLNEIIQGAVTVTRGQWHQVAELELDLNDALPPVECVGVAIKQVVLYAVMDAVESMAPRSGDIERKGKLRIASKLTPPDWATIEIRDNGRGLERSVVQQIMRPVLSSQAPQAVSEALAYARAVVIDQHHGRIEVESSKDGTTLSIHLPLSSRPVRASVPADS